MPRDGSGTTVHYALGVLETNFPL
ncbi:hypothetical protein EYZ11_013341 [Aspergillus tanneri]|uniref:Uncharacterized protein n=1 Tax=Aspergillus tanneri TaxID=1220188 RepID=A0A4S3IYF4_9EURO|nr:hypothetical protein EYZ11_013341 [Aspergillus tanneri]